MRARPCNVSFCTRPPRTAAAAAAVINRPLKARVIPRPAKINDIAAAAGAQEVAEGRYGRYYYGRRWRWRRARVCERKSIRRGSVSARTDKSPSFSVPGPRRCQSPVPVVLGPRYEIISTCPLTANNVRAAIANPHGPDAQAGLADNTVFSPYK